MKEVSIDQLCNAVESTHECSASLREAVPVLEKFNGRPVWEGVVHVFDVDHPDTNTCYAWSSPIDGTDRRRFYAVLGIPPINSPVDAIRASIVAENK